MKVLKKKDDPHSFFISETWDSVNVIRWISKKSRFRGPFDKQHGKRSQRLLKYGWKHLYQIHLSLPSQLSWKKSFLLTCKTLGLLVKTMAADEKYPVLNRDNLMIPIQMQLSEKQKSFSIIFTAFLKCRLNFQYFFDKFLKSPILEDPSTGNMVNVPKHCWNLHHSTFIIFFDHWQVNWVRKRLSYWHAKSWDCLLTHWLPMKSILFLIERI